MSVTPPVLGYFVHIKYPLDWERYDRIALNRSQHAAIIAERGQINPPNLINGRH